MRICLISDNVDTEVGMRMAGIEGVVAHGREETLSALNAALEDDRVAIILLTEPLVELCRDEVNAAKLNRSVPLIVEIPDRHGSGHAADAIARYVREAVGINL